MTTPIREKMIAKASELRGVLRTADPGQMALRSGAEYIPGANGMGVFRLKFYGDVYKIGFPDLEVKLEVTGKVCGLNRSSMFYYYLITADASPLTNNWIAFRDLPGGMFYHQAYQSYSGDRLAKAIDNRIAVFERAARNLGGLMLDLGDASFAFDALPRVRVAAVYHAGDEDFPASANVLFDGSASHYLPTDALAGVGSALVDRLTGSESRDEED